MGYPVISLTGWQAGFLTESTHRNARIKKINTERLQNELDKKNIVIVAGFQGINRYDDITTLGRGGSDTSAVAIAAAMKADKCEIYTDVDGVYTTDPRIVPHAHKLDEITYDEMLELDLRRQRPAQPVGGDGQKIFCKIGSTLEHPQRCAGHRSQGGLQSGKNAD